MYVLKRKRRATRLSALSLSSSSDDVSRSQSRSSSPRRRLAAPRRRSEREISRTLSAPPPPPLAPSSPPSVRTPLRLSSNRRRCTASRWVSDSLDACLRHSRLFRFWRDSKANVRIRVSQPKLLQVEFELTIMHHVRHTRSIRDPRSWQQLLRTRPDLFGAFSRSELQSYCTRPKK